MANTTKVLSRAAAAKYLRALFEAEPGLAGDAARRLADVCAREIVQVRVRRPLPVRGRGRQHQPAAQSAAQSPAEAAALAAATPPEVMPAEPVEPAFDPYAFSVIVALKREGPAGLMARLGAIASVERIRALADAQHIALAGDPATIEEARAALVAGAAARLSDRLAAAS